MLSTRQIRKLFRLADHDQMLVALRQNGLPLPGPLWVHLADSPIAATALGLRRLCELSYGPAPLISAMTEAVLAAMREDGTVAGPEGQADPVGTACVAAALERVIGLQGLVCDRSLLTAHERAIAAVVALQSIDAEDSLFVGGQYRSDSERLAAGALVLYLLGDSATFRQYGRVADLLNRLEDQQAQMDRSSQALLVMAALEAAQPATTPPARLRQPARAA